ncbi:MAG: hypothetical protein ABI680_06970 [Chthoniobacteraceae bacterium]
MIPYAELETFFCDLVARAQTQGIPCAITSGMACVHFGVAATTKDCDVLCLPEKSEEFRALIAATTLRGLAPVYRGHLSPPLDARWMRGGWTSHFTWKTRPDETCLDVFGIAPRGSSPWEHQLIGIYARPNVVAEMKRTNREKDWPFATSLGGEMLAAKDPNGWLHLFDVDVLRRTVGKVPIPARLETVRPLLKLAPFPDTIQVRRRLLAERLFWSELDELRVRIFQKHLRAYVSAVRKASGGRRDLPLAESHDIRVECAHRFLPERPLREYGLQKMVAAARTNVCVTLGDDVIDWFPAAEGNFYAL